ncbi:MAG: hypothetical protein PHN75_03935 [Syntrophales bacterium]|nr:hypothetical protein [Syntrophales bacterium]
MIGFLVIAMLAIPVTGLLAEDKPAADTKAAPVTVAAPAAPAAAEEEKPTGDATVAVLSQYFWRGYELSRNSIVVQPSLTVGYKGFSANVWGNMDTKAYYGGTDPGKSFGSTWNETDYTLSYAKTIGLFNLGAGYIYYGLGSLNKDAPKRADAQEVFASVGLNTLLSPTLTVYKEIGSYRQTYYLLGISHTFELGKMVSLKLAASGSYLQSSYADANLFNAGAGYGGYPKFDSNAQATNDNFNNFHDGNVTVTLPIKATKYITVTPTISYIFPLSDDAKYEMKGQGMKGSATPSDRDSSFVYGGLMASFTF